MSTSSVPFLRKTGQAWELIVEDNAFLIRGAELHNSSMSSAKYMDTVWQKLSDMGINTLLGAVTWADVEPQEGCFAFSELDAVLEGARAHGTRLIILWFGSFKNGMSSCIPSWVAKNTERFPRMLRRKDGKLEVTNAISIVSGEGAAADAKAFGALMDYLRQVDQRRTVIMVQVENEVGLLGDSRDRSPAADALFNSAVPAELQSFLDSEWDSLHPIFQAIHAYRRGALQGPAASSKRSWAEVFGDNNRADELFMAYHYAHYVEQVAAAGRSVYDLPLYTNAWIPMPFEGDGAGEPATIASGGGQPGEYPSGGPTPSVLDVWQKFAPSLDFLAPDIYAGDYGRVLGAYSHRGQALFVPEQRRDEYSARRVWAAIGSFGALGACPFGIDSVPASDDAFTKHYKLIASVSTIISQARLRPESISGFYFDEFTSTEDDRPIVKHFDGFDLTITRALVFGKPGPGFGLVIELEPGRFLLIGAGFKVEAASTSSTAVFTSVLRAEEKRVVDVEKGLLETERVLSGDETNSGAFVNMPNEDPDYGGCPIPVLFPARTMIAEVTFHSLDRSQVPGS
ncbi:glycoside hydrolase superfamily [Plectosphaerella plurivora]|uniref:Glycoside hydrolase superfamily n=1 Tax=Plectosphaerella plurivora TaxID=936078 RepID=A0A9P9A632_9PEZI|nr:glycoside hydrolase superfamily [Plectosphaerella plurivora]